MRPLTNGELAAFRRCQRKWWLGTVRGLRRRDWTPDPKSSLAVGTAYHAGQQVHYEGGDDASAIAAAHLEGNDLPAIMVEGYLGWLEESGADQELEVVEVERTLEAELPSGRRLWAKADVRGRLLSRWVVMDHKTCGSVDEYDTRANLLTQPKHYLLAERLSGQPSVEWAGQFFYNLARRMKRTVRANPPFYKRLPVYVTDRELEAYANRVEVQSARMEQLEQQLRSNPENAVALAYPNPTSDCTWDCPFFAVCPHFDRNPEAAELMLEAAYEEGDPLEHHTLEH